MPHSFLTSQGQFSMSHGPPLWSSRAFLWFRFRVQRPSYLHEASVWSPLHAHASTCFAPELSLLQGRDEAAEEAFLQVARFTKWMLYYLERGQLKSLAVIWEWNAIHLLSPFWWPNYITQRKQVRLNYAHLQTRITIRHRHVPYDTVFLSKHPHYKTNVCASKLNTQVFWAPVWQDW